MMTMTTMMIKVLINADVCGDECTAADGYCVGRITSLLW